MIGTNVANAVFNGTETAAGAPDWQAFWLVPAGFATIVAIIFMIVFRDRKQVEPVAA